MSRRPNVVPPQLLNLSLPLDVHSKLTLHLYSELEQRVPHGAYSRFIQERIREYFEHKQLDLASWANTDQGIFIVTAPSETIATLKLLLAGDLKP